MPYFPMFIDLQDRPCLIIGGGQVACRKAEKLLPYAPRLTVIAPDTCCELESLPGVTLLRRPYVPADLDGMALVIAATDNTDLNRAISAACRAKNIPVNVVDDRENCSFLFPCLVQKGALSVGISTGGASPTAAVWLKEQVSALIPSEFDKILVWLEALRPQFKEEIADETHRASLFSALFYACLAAGRPLTQAELKALLEEKA